MDLQQDFSEFEHKQKKEDLGLGHLEEEVRSYQVFR